MEHLYSHCSYCFQDSFNLISLGHTDGNTDLAIYPIYGYADSMIKASSLSNNKQNYYYFYPLAQ